MAEKRVKLIPASGPSLLTEFNELMVQNARKGEETNIELPNQFDRAFLVFYEAGIMPLEDTLSDGES